MRKTVKPDEINLCLPVSPGLIRVVSGIMESSALALGLDKDGALKFTLAGEEIYCHLITLPAIGKVTLSIVRGSYFVGATFSFATHAPELGSLNVTAKSRDYLNEDNGEAKLGLVLASRMTDKMRISRNGRDFSITMIQEKKYPRAFRQETESIPPIPPISVNSEPPPADIMQACLLTVSHYPEYSLPRNIFHPGKVADRVGFGDKRAIIAYDGARRIQGLIVVLSSESKCTEFYGPYVFSPEKRRETAGLLTEGMLNLMARTHTTGVYTIFPGEDMSGHGFEKLGSLKLYKGDDDSCRLLPAYFRALREDLGAQVYAHPDYAGFLRDFYREFSFFREILAPQDLGGNIPEQSVFSTCVRREARHATVTCMLEGRDAAENAARHVDVLIKEGIVNIFFIIDLSCAFQAELGGSLTRIGFVPAMVVPWADRADILVFEYDKESR